ncbi:MAG: hypothetical protein ACRC7O_01740, partial [Fimbriiglobus sp.]
GTQFGGVHYWTPPSERAKRLVGKVESVLPADSRTVQVRVVMENPGEGADALQDRGLATIIIYPDGSTPLTGGVPLPAPAPRPMGAAAPKADTGIRLAGGVVEEGGIVQAAASSPVVVVAEKGVSAPVTSQPIPAPPVNRLPASDAPLTAPPAAGTLPPRVGPAVFTLPQPYPANRR